MHHRLPRIVGALGLALALTGGSVVGGVIAAEAPLDVMTGTVNLSPQLEPATDPPTYLVSVSDFTTTPPTINLAGFTLRATNTSTSTNISQLYLSETNGDYVYAVQYDSGPTGVCTEGYLTTGVKAALSCDFGALGPTDYVQITVAIISPTKTGSWTPDFQWNTNGNTSSGKNNSRSGGPNGGLFDKSWPFQVVSPTSGNSAGTFIWDTSQATGGNVTVQNNQNLNKNNNTQSASLTVNGNAADHFPLAVADGPGVNPPAVTAGVDCTTYPIVTQWTSLNVNDDHTLSSPLHATIVVYHGPNPSQVNGVCYVHYDWNTGETVGTVLLNAPEPDGGLCPSTPPADAALPCFTLSSAGPNLRIDFYSLNNGHAGTF
jgi:hypothetical protein